MTTTEFKIGVVYSPDGGRTNILIAAQTLEGLKSAWIMQTSIQFKESMCVVIEEVKGRNLSPSKRSQPGRPPLVMRRITHQEKP